MALSKREIANQVLVHLDKIGIKLNDNEIKRLVEQNMVTIFGSECKVANIMTASRFNVTVNKKWFLKADNKQKPYFKVDNIGPQIEFENVLFPTKHNLFILHYLSLRECCLELELDRNTWFGLSKWGVELDEASGTFKWAGGNRKQFKVEKVSSLKVHTQPLSPSDAIEDLNELPEGVVGPEKTYRLSGSYARDAKVRSYVIARAKGVCEYCGEEGFLMSDGKSHYLEAHHIIALADEGKDTIENVIALCPRHHREAHYGINRVNLEAKMANLLKSK